MTQKILTTVKFHTVIQSFLNVFSLRKKNHSVFQCFKKSRSKSIKNCISGIFWAFKSELQIIYAFTYIAMLLSEPNNCFSVVSCFNICLNNSFVFDIVRVAFFCFYFTFFFLLCSSQESSILLQHALNFMAI